MHPAMPNLGQDYWRLFKLVSFRDCFDGEQGSCSASKTSLLFIDLVSDLCFIYRLLTLLIGTTAVTNEKTKRSLCSDINESAGLLISQYLWQHSKCLVGQPPLRAKLCNMVVLLSLLGGKYAVIEALHLHAGHCFRLIVIYIYLFIWRYCCLDAWDRSF